MMNDGSEDQKILQIYMMPYNHFGSYLSGVIIGYFLVQHADKQIPNVCSTLTHKAHMLLQTISHNNQSCRLFKP